MVPKRRRRDSNTQEGLYRIRANVRNVVFAPLVSETVRQQLLKNAETETDREIVDEMIDKINQA